MRLPGRDVDLLEGGTGALFGSDGREGLEELLCSRRVFEHRSRPVGGDGARADWEDDCRGGKLVAPREVANTDNNGAT